MFASFVFLDFETTGLVDPEVTSACALATDSHRCLTSKFSMYFNPNGKPIEPEASRLTQLTNDKLVSYQRFTPFGIDALIAFLKLLPRPVCLIAHNGRDFDFILLDIALRRSKNILPGYIVLLDSLDIFREIHPDLKSHRLENVYKHLFGSLPSRSHSAEDDCSTLSDCFFKSNAVNFISENYTLE